jgi:hypothetical protein
MFSSVTMVAGKINPDQVVYTPIIYRLLLKLPI